MAESKAPELILHVGMPKAGSTALQKMLHRHSRALEAEGVFYPRIDSRVAHQFLSLPLDFDINPPRIMKHVFGGDAERAKQHFLETWDVLSSRIDRIQPKTVVLSSEYLYMRAKAASANDLFDRLRDRFARITVLIYVRSPSSYVASLVQQRVKFSGTFGTISPPRYRRNIEAWEEQFPDAVVVRQFDRAAFHGGDIVADFLKNFLGVEPGEIFTPTFFNTSLSAESVAVLQEFQRRFFPDKDDVPLGIKKTLRASLQASEKIVKPPKARLRPEWERFLDESCEDLIWLRDRYGLEFPGIDYGRIRLHDAPGPDPDLIAELFHVDDRVRRRLKLLSHLAAPRLWNYMLR